MRCSLCSSSRGRVSRRGRRERRSGSSCSTCMERYEPSRALEVLMTGTAAYIIRPSIGPCRDARVWPTRRHMFRSVHQLKTPQNHHHHYRRRHHITAVFTWSSRLFDQGYPCFPFVRSNGICTGTSPEIMTLWEMCQEETNSLPPRIMNQTNIPVLIPSIPCLLMSCLHAGLIPQDPRPFHVPSSQFITNQE